MIERTQPVVTGVDKNGELIWGIVAMARWQMEMFRVKYYGDFMAFWMMRQLRDMTGMEPDEPVSSMDISKVRDFRKKKAPPRTGD
jgi:hypothetical protein